MMFTRGGIRVACLLLFVGVAHAAPKILPKLTDSKTQLSLGADAAGTTAVWMRVFAGKTIPVDKRALVVHLAVADSGGDHCDHASVTVDDKPIASTLEVEHTGANCGTPDGQSFGLRIERVDLPPLEHAKRVVVTLCDQEIVVDAAALGKLVKRALADR